MIFSAQQIFSDDQEILTTAISENVIDLGAPSTPYGGVAALNHDIGKGNPVPILVQVTTDFTSSTATAVTFTLECSAAAGLTSPDVLATETVLLADLVAGKQLFLQYLPNGATKRYLGVRYTGVTGVFDTGKVTAGVTMGNQTNVTGA